MDYFLKRGERGLLVGKTGSGKTEHGLFHLRHTGIFPAIILDTKIEDKFFGLQENNYSLDVCQSLEELDRFSRLQKKKLPDYILVRPPIDEILEIDPLNDYSRLLFDRFGSCFIYYDELYNWHRHGIPGKGVLTLLTQGRSKGKTFLGGSQRPAWISQFFYSEAEKFFIHFLVSKKDREKFDAYIPNYSKLAPPPEYHSYFFNTTKDEKPTLIAPVPYEKLDPKKIFSRKWL